jgi:IS30 family transposase
MSAYNHYTLFERESLQKLLGEGKSKAEIARTLGRSRSSVGREIKRNSNKDGSYNFWRATSLYLQRRKHCRRKFRLSDPNLKEFVKAKLKVAWSPETISEKWNEDHPEKKVCFCTLYRAIKRKLIKGVSEAKHLRRRGRLKYKRGNKEGSLKPDHTIHERPQEANHRTEYGHFEGDLVHCKNGFLFTAVDRMSRFMVIKRMDKRTASVTTDTIINALSEEKIKSLTLDRGTEFSNHRKFAAALDTTVYFCDPHSPWQRGTNENFNDVLRFFFPRSCDLSAVSDDEILSVMDLINDRPRKCLGWLSPKEFLVKLSI